MVSAPQGLSGVRQRKETGGAAAGTHVSDRIVFACGLGTDDQIGSKWSFPPSLNGGMTKVKRG